MNDESYNKNSSLIEGASNEVKLKENRKSRGSFGNQSSLEQQVLGVTEAYRTKHKQNIANMLSHNNSDLEQSKRSSLKKNPLENIPLLKEDSVDTNDNDDDQLALNMIIMQIELMGFRRDMIEALFEYEDSIEDVNQAVEMLIYGANGWTHKFVKDPFTQLCKICKGYSMDH